MWPTKSKVFLFWPFTESWLTPDVYHNFLELILFYQVAGLLYHDLSDLLFGSFR